MPILGSRGAASAKGFGFTGNSRRTSATYWIASQGITTTNNDSNNVTSSFVQIPSNTTVLYRDFSTTGSITTSTNVVGPFSGGFNVTGFDANTSSAGFTSSCGFVQTGNSPNTYDPFVMVFNSSGSRVTSNTRFRPTGSAAIASAGNVTSHSTTGYVTANSAPQTLFRYTVSTGSLIAGVAISGLGASGNGFVNSMSANASQLIGFYLNSTSLVKGIVSFTPTLSAVNWAKEYSVASVASGGNNSGVALDASNNSYFVSDINGDLVVLKLDSSGAVVDKRYIASVTPKGCFIYGTTLYVCATDLSGGYTRGVLIALDVSTSTISLLGAKFISQSALNCSTQSVSVTVNGVFMGVYTQYYGTILLPLDITDTSVNGTYTDEYKVGAAITIGDVSYTLSSYATSPSSITPTVAVTSTPSMNADSCTASSASTTLTTFYVITP